MWKLNFDKGVTNINGFKYSFQQILLGKLDNPL